MAQIYSDITETIGRTPLVRLNSLAEGLGANVIAKLESAKPRSGEERPDAPPQGFVLVSRGGKVISRITLGNSAQASSATGS